MNVTFYMDVHVPAAITRGLLMRNVDVLTAQLDNNALLEDSALLDRAAQLGRVLFSQDDDLLTEAAARQRNGVEFAGLIYAHQLAITIGKAIEDLELIAKTSTQEEFSNHVEFLPL